MSHNRVQSSPFPEKGLFSIFLVHSLLQKSLYIQEEDWSSHVRRPETVSFAFSTDRIIIVPKAGNCIISFLNWSNDWYFCNLSPFKRTQVRYWGDGTRTRWVDHCSIQVSTRSICKDRPDHFSDMLLSKLDQEDFHFYRKWKFITHREMIRYQGRTST